MKRAEFKNILTMALTKSFDLPGYLSEATEPFLGCALHNKRIFATEVQFAAMIVGHVLTFGGTIDQEGLAEMELLSKRVDII
jgi:hypothetical protein